MFNLSTGAEVKGISRSVMRGFVLVAVIIFVAVAAFVAYGFLQAAGVF